MLLIRFHLNSCILSLNFSRLLLSWDFARGEDGWNSGYCLLCLGWSFIHRHKRWNHIHLTLSQSCTSKELFSTQLNCHTYQACWIHKNIWLTVKWQFVSQRRSTCCDGLNIGIWCIITQIMWKAASQVWSRILSLVCLGFSFIFTIPS